MCQTLSDLMKDEIQEEKQKAVAIARIAAIKTKERFITDDSTSLKKRSLSTLNFISYLEFKLLP